jgi:hypothetical protein
MSTREAGFALIWKKHLFILYQIKNGMEKQAIANGYTCTITVGFIIFCGEGV